MADTTAPSGAARFKKAMRTMTLLRSRSSSRSPSKPPSLENLKANDNLESMMSSEVDNQSRKPSPARPAPTTGQLAAMSGVEPKTNPFFAQPPAATTDPNMAEPASTPKKDEEPDPRGEEAQAESQKPAAYDASETKVDEPPADSQPESTLVDETISMTTQEESKATMKNGPATKLNDSTSESVGDNKVNLEEHPQESPQETQVTGPKPIDVPQMIEITDVDNSPLSSNLEGNIKNPQAERSDVADGDLERQASMDDSLPQEDQEAVDAQAHVSDAGTGIEDVVCQSEPENNRVGARGRKLSLVKKTTSFITPRSRSQSRNRPRQESMNRTSLVAEARDKESRTSRPASPSESAAGTFPFLPRLGNITRPSSPQSFSSRRRSFSGSFLSLKRRPSGDTAATSLDFGSKQKRNLSGDSDLEDLTRPSRLSHELSLRPSDEFNVPSPIPEEAFTPLRSALPGSKQQTEEHPIRYRYRGTATTSVNLPPPDVCRLNALDLASTKDQKPVDLERLINMEFAFLLQQDGSPSRMRRHASSPAIPISKSSSPFVSTGDSKMPSRIYASTSRPLVEQTGISKSKLPEVTLGTGGINLLPVQAYPFATRQVLGNLRAAPAPPVTSNPHVGFQALGGIYGTYAKPRPRLTSTLLPTLRNASSRERAQLGIKWVLDPKTSHRNDSDLATKGESPAETAQRAMRLSRSERLAWQTASTGIMLPSAARQRTLTQLERERRRNTLRELGVWLPDELEEVLGEEEAIKFGRKLIRRYSLVKPDPPTSVLTSEDEMLSLSQALKDTAIRPMPLLSGQPTTVAYVHVFDIVPAGGRQRSDSAPPALEADLVQQIQESLTRAQELRNKMARDQKDSSGHDVHDKVVSWYNHCGIAQPSDSDGGSAQALGDGLVIGRIDSPKPESLRPPPPPRKRRRQCSTNSTGLDSDRSSPHAHLGAVRSMSPVVVEQDSNATGNGVVAELGSVSNTIEGTNKADDHRSPSSSIVGYSGISSHNRDGSKTDTQNPPSSLGMVTAIVLIWGFGAFQFVSYTTSAVLGFAYKVYSKVRGWARVLVFWGA